MKKLGFFGFILTFLFACTSIVEKPENLIEQEKMVSILTDVYMHQQASYLSEINQDGLGFAKIDAQILYNHQTNSTDFQESYRYYYLHPELYNEILIDVRDNLESKLPEADRKKRIEDRENKEKK